MVLIIFSRAFIKFRNSFLRSFADGLFSSTYLSAAHHERGQERSQYIHIIICIYICIHIHIYIYIYIYMHDYNYNSIQLIDKTVLSLESWNSNLKTTAISTKARSHQLYQYTSIIYRYPRSLTYRSHMPCSVPHPRHNKWPSPDPVGGSRDSQRPAGSGATGWFCRSPVRPPAPAPAIGPIIPKISLTIGSVHLDVLLEMG